MRVLSSRALVIAMSAIGLAVAAQSAQAQQPSGSRWQGWLGCWSAEAGGKAPDAENAGTRIVCITPTRDADVVEVSAIADGKVLSRDKIDASGRPVPIDANGCTGTAHAQWSADQHRVFLKSTVTCSGVQSDVAAILGITPAGEWLDVRSVAFGGGSNVQVARYRDFGLSTAVPSDVAMTFQDQHYAIQNARNATGTPVSTNAVIEASHQMDPAVVEAWINANGQRYAVDARSLTDMSNAGVPTRVTDAMIAASKTNDVRNSNGGGYGFYDGRFAQQQNDGWDQGTGLRIIAVKTPPVDSWAYGYWSDGYLFGYSPYVYSSYFYAPFGYSAFIYAPVVYARYGFASVRFAPFFYTRYGYTPYEYGPWGYAPFGFASRGGGVVYVAPRGWRRSVTGYVHLPVIETRNASTGVHGVVQKGTGYAQGPVPNGAADPRTAAPRPGSGAGSPPPGVAPAPARSAEPAPHNGGGEKGNGGGERSSGGGGRTAHGKSR